MPPWRCPSPNPRRWPPNHAVRACPAHNSVDACGRLNTTKSSGSALPTILRTSPASRRLDRRSSDHADAAQSSDVSDRVVSVCPDGNATTITAEGG